MTTKLAKIVLSIVVGMLGLVLVMTMLACSGPAAAKEGIVGEGDNAPLAWEEGPGEGAGGALAAAGVPTDVIVDRDPTEILADGDSNSTITGQVRDNSCQGVPGAFIAFTTSLGTIDQYCYEEAEGISVNKSPGDWTEYNFAGASGGKYVKACGTVSPNWLNWTFTATAVSMLYVKRPSGGFVEVWVDNGPHITVDTCDPINTTAAERVITAGLSSGQHVITVTFKAQNNSPGCGSCIQVDAFRCGTTTDINGEATATLTSTVLSCGSEDATVTALTGAPSIPYMITGTNLVEMTASSPHSMTVTASPNAITVGVGTADLEATVEDQFGEYVPNCTMVSFVTDENGSDPGVWAILPYDLVEGEDDEVAKAGSWSTGTNSYHGGEVISSTTAGATASWNFTGTAVSLIYPKLSDAGVATVTVDSGAPITIDMYAPSPGQYQVEHVITHGLSSDQHVITVTVGGYTVTSGTDTRVYIDAFRSGTSTSGGTATAVLTAGTQAGVLWAEAAGVGRPCCEMDSVVTDTVPITLTAGDPYTLTITPTDASITCCVTSTLQFTVTDRYSNVVGAVVPTTLMVDFTSTPYGVFTPTSPVVVTDGVGSVKFHGWTVGTGTITGTVNGYPATGTVALTVAVGSCQTLTISSDHRPWLYVTDTNVYLLPGFPYTTTISANLSDSCGNPVQNDTVVTFTTSLGNLSPLTQTTINGIATAVLTSGNLSAGVPPQTAYITVTGAGCPVSDTTTVDFVWHVYTLTVGAVPDTMPVGGNLSALAAVVTDGVGSPVLNGVRVSFTTIPSPTAMFSVPAGYVETVGGTVTSTATSGTQAGVARVEAAAIGSVVTNTTPITITAGDPYTLTITPTDVSITCCVTSTLQFTVTDQYSNVVGAVVSRTLTVSFTSTPQGDFTPSPPSVVITNGVGSVKFHGYEVGTGTITGTINGYPVTGTAALTVTAGACQTLTISPDHRPWIYVTDTHISLLIGFPYTTTITAELRDKCNNPVQNGTAVTFTTSLGYLSPANPITTVNGIATAVLTSGQLAAGVPTQTAYITVTGASCPVSDTTSVDFVRHVYTLTVTADPDEMAVGGYTSTLTADVNDGFGNPIPDGVRVVFTITPAAKAWVLPGYVETESGKAITTATSVTQTGKVTITAVAGSTVTNTGQITIKAGDPDTLIMTPADLSITCCNYSTLQFTVTDQYSNVVGAVASRLVSVCLTCSPDELVDSWAGSNCVSILTGTGSVDLHGWMSGTGEIEGYASRFHPDTVVTSSLTVVAGPPVSLTVTRAPDAIPASDGADAAVITATVSDGCGNLLCNRIVTFTTDHGSFEPPPTMTLSITGTTNCSGVATATLVSRCSSGRAHITVTTDSLSGTTYVDFVGLYVHEVHLVAAPTSIEVGGNTSILTATVEDVGNNPVFDGTVVTFTTSLGILGSDWITETTTGGVATATLTSQTEAGTAVITAAADSKVATTTVQFTPLSADSVTLAANPSSISLNGSTSTLEATVKDEYGNLVEPTVVTFTTSSGSLGSDPFTSTTTSGVATAILTSETTAGTAFITATVDSEVATTTVEFEPDPPYTLTLEAAPTTRTVGEPSMLTATVTDQYSNTVANGTVVTFTTSLGNLSSDTVTTTDGKATATLTSQSPGTATITAEADTISDTKTVVFNVGLPATVTLEAYPMTLTVGSSSALTTTVTDQYSNSVADGTVVTFTTSLGDVGSQLVTKTTTGVAIAELTSQMAGTATVTATADSKSDTTNVTFQPDLPCTVTLDAHPITLTVGETSSLTATVKDEYGNLVEPTVVTFTTSFDSLSSETITKTTSSGVATTTLTSQEPGTATITATIGMTSAIETVVFSAGSPATVTLEADPENIWVGGYTSTLTVTVTDQYTNPVANNTVVTLTTSSGSLGSETITKTTSDGVATAVLTSGIEAGKAIITATCDSVTGTTIVTFDPDLPNTVTVEADPTSIPIGGFTSTITATVRDQYGNLVAETEVTFVTDLGSIGSSNVVKTTFNGVATATLTSGLIIGTANITATADSAVGQTQMTFTVGAPETVTAESWPPTIEVGGNTATITATVRDIGGYLVADDTPVVFTTDFGSLGSTTVTKTTVSGVATTTLTSPQTPGVAHITTTSNSKFDTAIVKVAAGPPFTIDVMADPADIPIGGATSRITATVKDQYGNNVTNGTNVDFITTMGSVWPPSDTTIEGTAVTTLTSGMNKGTAVVSAISGPESGLVEVVFTTGPPFYINVVADPTSIGLNGQTSDIQATVKDIGGNNVVDGTVVTFTTSLGALGSDTVTRTTTSGMAAAVLTSETAAGTAVITATADSKYDITEVVINPDPPYTVTLTADPPAIPANGISTSAVRATVTDQYGNMVADDITCHFDTTLGTVSPPSDTTYNGVAETTLTSSDEPGLAVVTATCEGIPDTIHVFFYSSLKLYLPVIRKAY